MFSARCLPFAHLWTTTIYEGLACGSNAQLRALAGAYAQSDAATKFAHDFAEAWAKVMDADLTAENLVADSEAALAHRLDTARKIHAEHGGQRRLSVSRRTAS